MNNLQWTLSKWETWPPQVRLPDIPAVKCWEVEFLQDRARGIDKMPAEMQPSVHLPPEFYLGGLLTLPIETKGDIRRVIESWGFLFGRYDDYDKRNRFFKLYEADGSLGGWAGYSLETSHFGAYFRGIRAIADSEASGSSYRPFELYEETRLGLVWLRDLSRLAQTYVETGSLGHLPYEWESERYGIPRPPNASYAEAIFTTGINAALQWVHPYIHVPSHDPDPALTAAAHMGYPPMFSVIAMQIYNHIATGETFSVCANETCPRPRKLFNRHIDRSGKTSDNPRTTAKYCSDQCRNTQRRREQRRMKRAEREES